MRNRGRSSTDILVQSLATFGGIPSGPADNEGFSRLAALRNYEKLRLSIWPMHQVHLVL